MRPLAGLIGLWVSLAASPSLLCAQTASEFYKGKTVDVYIGTSVGGDYDAYSLDFGMATNGLHPHF